MNKAVKLFWVVIIVAIIGGFLGALAKSFTNDEGITETIIIVLCMLVPAHYMRLWFPHTFRKR